MPTYRSQMLKRIEGRTHRYWDVARRRVNRLWAAGYHTTASLATAMAVEESELVAGACQVVDELRVKRLLPDAAKAIIERPGLARTAYDKAARALAWAFCPDVVRPYWPMLAATVRTGGSFEQRYGAAYALFCCVSSMTVDELDPFVTRVADDVDRICPGNKRCAWLAKYMRYKDESYCMGYRIPWEFPKWNPETGDVE